MSLRYQAIEINSNRDGIRRKLNSWVQPEGELSIGNIYVFKPSFRKDWSWDNHDGQDYILTRIASS